MHSPELYGMEGAGALRKILEEKEVYIDKFMTLKDGITVDESKNVSHISKSYIYIHIYIIVTLKCCQSLLLEFLLSN